MATVIRSSISRSNPYYISKHRYYELKYHCLQYAEWAQEMAKLRTRSLSTGFLHIHPSTACMKDETASKAILEASISTQMEEVNECCKIAGGDISDYLFRSVTEGKSYTRLNPPCSKHEFYQRYRYFFWLLSQRV